MNDIITLPNTLKRSTWIEIKVDFMAICPVPDKPYSGTLFVEYIPKDTILEWDSFSDWVKGLYQKEMTAEQAVDFITTRLENLLCPIELRVELDVDSAFHVPVKIVQFLAMKEEE